MARCPASATPGRSREHHAGRRGHPARAGFGSAPFTATFSGSGSSDFDGDPLTSIWNFGDGTGATGLSVSHTYDTPGQFDAVLTISDTHGAFARDTVSVNVWKERAVPEHDRPRPVPSREWSDRRAVGRQHERPGDREQRRASGEQHELSDLERRAVFGPDQEVFVTFDSLATGGERDLMLKVQGTLVAGQPRPGAAPPPTRRA